MTLQLSVAVAAAWPSIAVVSAVVLLQQLLLVAVAEQLIAAAGLSASVVEIEVAVVEISLHLVATAGSSSTICLLLFHQELRVHLVPVEEAVH